MMSKIQNLNGTHNYFASNSLTIFVVYDVKDTKFEWNSQPLMSISNVVPSCLWCQRYKIWMELTTCFHNVIFFSLLFMMSKIQNLNGTHNPRLYEMHLLLLFMMSKIQNLNGTHNLRLWISSASSVVYDVKDTKFEWNSQPGTGALGMVPGCLWCQRYKIWMELTTEVTPSNSIKRLFMMSKIQNLNGTHNFLLWISSASSVVYDVKDTKFEWNSQPKIYDILNFFSCLWCQRYKIWMELTTQFQKEKKTHSLFMMSKIQNLNGTHNVNNKTCARARCLWCQRYKI